MLLIPVDKEIVLKLPTYRNADELFALVDRNRAYLKQFLPWVDHNLKVEDSKRFIHNCRSQHKAGMGFSLCIFYQNKIVGTLGLHHIDTVNYRTELGYWLAEDQQGKGIMHRSCQAFITYVFETLKLHRIDIECAIDNPASQQVAENLGFTKEATLRESSYLNGIFHDTFLYRLLANEFKERKG
jgi:ribosomal-protein-serine acetyltransferase